VRLLIQVFILKSIILLPCVRAVIVESSLGMGSGNGITSIWDSSLESSEREVEITHIGPTGQTDAGKNSPDPVTEHREEIATWFQDSNFSEEELFQAVDLTEEIISNSKELLFGIVPIPLEFEEAKKVVEPFIRNFSDSRRLMRTLQDMAQMSNPYYPMEYLNFVTEDMQEEDFNALLDLSHELSEEFTSDVGYSLSVLNLAADLDVINAVKERGASEIADVIKKVDEKLGGTEMGAEKFDPGWLFIKYSLPSLFGESKDSFEEVLPYVEVFNKKIAPYLKNEFMPYVKNRIDQELNDIPEENRREEKNQALRTFYTRFLSPLLTGGMGPQELEKIMISPQIMEDVQDLSLIYRHSSDKIQFGSTKLLLTLRDQGFSVEEALREYNTLREKVLTAPGVGRRENGDWYQKLLPQFVSNYGDFIARELAAGKDLSEVYAEVDTLLDFGTLWPNRFSWELWKEVLIPNWNQWQNLRRDKSGVIQEYPSQPVAFSPYSGYDTNNAFVVGSEDEDVMWKFHHQGIFVIYPPEILTFSDLLEFFGGGINPEKGLYPRYIVFSGHGLPDRMIGHMESPGAPLFSDETGTIISDTSEEYISTDLVSSLGKYFNRLVSEGGYVIFNACSVGDESGESASLATVFAETFGKNATIFAPVDLITKYQINFDSEGKIESVKYFNDLSHIWEGGIVPTRIFQSD